MKYVDKFIVSAGATALLSACGSFDGVSDNSGGKIEPAAASRPATAGVADYPVKLGKPYQIGGKTYTPADAVDYDEVGYASFYGQELAGKPTANGETFIPSASTAAHKTLPLPSYLEVTSLATGKTILVRVNDRGPFVDDRLIDLSEGAARQLGITQDGVAGVRLRKVNPPEQERAVLRQGGQAVERIETPDSLLVVLREKLAKLPQPSARPASRPALASAGAITGSATPPAGKPSGRFIREGSTGQEFHRRPIADNRPAQRREAARRQAEAKRQAVSNPNGQRSGQFIREGGDTSSAVRSVPAATSGYVVQLAAFGSKTRADTLAAKLGANVQQSSDGRLFRVRYGPYASAAEAQSGLATAKQRGYPNARIFRQ